MKKIILLVFFTFVFFILDNALMPFVAIKGYYPSLLFLFCICYSIVNGSWEGMWLGIFGGCLQDIIFTNTFGINALTTMLMCVLAGVIGKSLFKEKIIMPIAVILLISLLKGTLTYMILYVIGQYISFQGFFYSGLYTMIVSIAMYKWVYNLCQKKYMERKWRF